MPRKSGSISISILCACAVLSKYLVIVPEYMVKYVGNAAWIDILAKSFFATLSLLVVLYLYKPLAPLSFPEVCLMLGKTFSGIVGYVYIVGFTLFNSLLFRLLVEALSTVMATTAPDEFFALFVLIPVFFAAYIGTTATNRLCCIIFPFVIITLFTVCIALIPHYSISNIMPVFGTSTATLTHGIFAKHFGFNEILLLLFFAPLLGSYKEIRKTGLLSVLLICIFSVLFTLAYCLSVPYPASKDFFLPFYQMTRMIKSGAFLQRLEPIVVFVWASFVMCSMSVLISIASRLLSRSESDNDAKAFVPIVTLITFFISILPKSENAAFFFYEKLLGVSTLLFPLLPVFTLLFARKKQRRQYSK